MLDPKLVRTRPAEVAEQLKRRGFQLDVDLVESLESRRKEIQVRTQQLQNERKVGAKKFGQLKAKGEDISSLKADMDKLSEEVKKAEAELHEVQVQWQDLMLGIPNIPHDSVPKGETEDDNEEIRRWGDPKQLNFEPQDHVALGAKHGWMDFDAAAKLTGSRFIVMRGPIAKLQHH